MSEDKLNFNEAESTEYSLHAAMFKKKYSILRIKQASVLISFRRNKARILAYFGRILFETYRRMNMPEILKF